MYRQAKAQRGETGGTKSQRFRRVEAGPDLLKRLADLKAWDPSTETPVAV